MSRSFRWILVMQCLVVLLASCRTSRPDSIASWDACVIRAATLSHKPLGWLVEPGDDSVLYLHTRWGESPFASEYQFSYLLLVLPVSMTDGEVVTISTDRGAAGEYREGSMSLAYDSEHITGTVTQQRSSDDELELLLRLHATSPSVDVTLRGDVPIEGLIEAELVSSQGDCD